MEYSFSAFAAAQFARAMAKTNDYETLMRFSRGWENLYDKDSGFIRPKDGAGQFISDFEPRKPWIGFQEGNAYQYTFYVPHNPAGLIERMGLPTFQSRLAGVFAEAEKTGFGGGTNIDAFSGLENVYNHGNQPSLHIAWLFNYAGQPWLTQHWVRRICDVFYGNEPVHGYGYGQDEDQGQLGAWYVLAAMGLFDVGGGTAAQPTLQLASPLFDRIQIRLNPTYHAGETFNIHVRRSSAANSYIQSAKLNGVTLNRCWIPWREVVGQGGTLELDLGDKPNFNWGSQTPPPSLSGAD